MEELILKVPDRNELIYRKKILSDQATMNYNKALDARGEGYCKKTGCIDFHEALWDGWFDEWINQNPKKYYAYLYDKTLRSNVGEVALRYVEEEKAYMSSIIIEDKYRGFGYGKAGLLLLLDMAFNEYNAEEVIDDFPINRKIANRLFKKMGFKVKSANKDTVIHALSHSQYQKVVG